MSNSGRIKIWLDDVYNKLYPYYFPAEIIKDTSNLRLVAARVGEATMISISVYAYTIAAGGTIGTITNSKIKPSATRISGGCLCNSAGTGMIYQSVTVDSTGAIKAVSAWSGLYGQIVMFAKA